MSDASETGVGAVAIHRWFADGEGWAYHPWYEAHMLELLATLKDELDTRRQQLAAGGRMFERRAFGGVLWGEQAIDPDCPDLRAAGRRPTVLRSVFLRGSPPNGQRSSLAARLASVQAERAGPDVSLLVDVGEIPRKPLSGKTPDKRYWPILGILVALIALSSLAALLVWLQFFYQRPVDWKNEIESAATKMTDLLKTWRAESPATDRKAHDGAYQVAHHFLRFLSHEHAELEGRLQGGHPDAGFAHRLPPSAAKPQSPEELRRAVEGLLVQLSGRTAPPSPDKARPLTELLDEVAQQMDYIRWWNAEGCHLDYAADEKADAEVVKFAYRFIVETPAGRANRGWQKPAADAMAQRLRKSWRVEAITAEDVDKRPWLVYHCFFQLLSQRHFQDVTLSADAPQAVFIGRLPKTSLTENGHFVSENELIGKLQELAKTLNAPSSPIVATLVSNIANKMDYESWKKRTEGDVTRGPASVSPRVEQFVNRFRTAQ